MTATAPSLRQSTTESLTAWLYNVGWKVTRALPEPAANSVFRQMADTLWRRHAGGVDHDRVPTPLVGHGLITRGGTGGARLCSLYPVSRSLSAEVVVSRQAWGFMSEVRTRSGDRKNCAARRALVGFI